MPPLDDWLKRNGLEALAETLASEDIDLQTLGELTDAEFKELGLTLGQRKRIQRALREDIAAATARSEGKVQRRYLTVMFCDVVGSTALGARFDSEDMLEILTRYRSHCSSVVAKRGGMVARLVGDGVLAYFGYPVAHESDAERAVHAALEIVDGIGGVELPDRSALQVRIAIATGLVVVGDMSLQGAADRNSVVGTAPNIAARLQTAAAPNTVVVASTTHRLIEGYFRCDALGAVPVAGLEEPVQAWRIVSSRPVASRFRARLSGRTPTPLIGRDPDLSWLGDLWEAACRGDGRVAVVIGEPGIGKSRLVETFATSIVQADAKRISFSASPFGVQTPFDPILRQLERIAGSGRGTALDDMTRRIARLCAGDGTGRQHAATVLVQLLDPAEAGDPTENPRHRRAAINDTILRQFDALSRRGPLLVTVDDLHWLDPTSLETLSMVASDLRHRRVLLIATTRHEPSQPWLVAPEAEILRLRRLDPAASRAMAEAVAGTQPTSPALLARIVRQAEGVPLVIEEFTRGAAEGARPERSDGQELAVPETLQESLLARLDRAGPARQIASAAAVVSSTLSRQILAQVAELSAHETDAGLASLVTSGILEPESGRSGHYRFHHTLLRETAYSSLMRDARRAMHARAATTLRETQPRLSATRPEILAHHLSEAGAHAEAASAWMAAGRRSLDQSALEEAVAELRSGLEQLRLAPAGDANLEGQIKFVALLGPALFALRGPGSREVEDLYAESMELCSQLPEAASHFPVYWGWWRISRDFRIKRQRAEELLRRARRRQDEGLLLQAHHCGWASAFSAADMHRTLEHIEAGLALYRSGDFRSHAALYGNHDAKTCALCERGLVRWIRGAPAAAEADLREAQRWAAQINHVGTRFHFSDYALALAYYRRDIRRVLTRATELLERAGEMAFTEYGARGAVYRGWARSMLGDAQNGAAEIGEGLARLQDIGTMEDFPLYFCMLAEAMSQAGQAERALDRIVAGQAQLESAGVHIWAPELWRWIGQLHLAVEPSDDAKAESAMSLALRLAETQAAPALALRVATSLARHLAERTRHDEALRIVDRALNDTLPEPEDPEKVAARSLRRAIARNATRALR